MSTAHFVISGFTKTDVPGNVDQGPLHAKITDSNGVVIATVDVAPATLSFDLDFTGTGDFVGSIQSVDINGNLIGVERTLNFSTSTTNKQFDQADSLSITVS